VVLDFDTAGVPSGKQDYKILQEEKPARAREGRGGFNDDERVIPKRTFSKNIADTEGGSVTVTLIYIRLYNRTELGGKASVFSTRGGVLKDKEFIIR
jgi:hypothetical protein